MGKKVLWSLFVLAVLSFRAQAYFVGNFSFEDPAAGKLTNWTDVPFWSSDRVAVNSGVESDWPGSTHGIYSGYLMADDPSVWQLTNNIIIAGNEYTLLVDARNNYTAVGPAKLGIMLYFDHAGTRTPVALSIVDLGNDWATYSLSFAAASAPVSIGKQIGIEFINVSTPASWVGIDNVRLIPEPMTMLLLGLGALLMRKRS